MMFQGSWRTTAFGVAQFLTVLTAQVTALLDDDPATVADWGLVITAAIVLGGFLFTRDDKVTSRDAGAE